MHNISKQTLVLGVCDYPEHVPKSEWAKHAAEQKALGLKVVRLAEFCWAKIEPSLGVFDWQWLDEAIEVYERHGLDLVLCTPTATPPAWLIAQHPEILAIDQNNQTKKFGSRRHYDHASPIYRDHCLRIVNEIAGRYGHRASVIGWQTDNELGHEGTAASYGGASLTAFREWLQEKYSNLLLLNQAWGNVFWSQDYSSWQQIQTPNLTAVNQPNPSHLLDFKCFCSDMIIEFQQLQIDRLRQLSPGRFITHNFVIFAQEFDLYKASENLDFVAWDSYPIGMLEFFATWETEAVKTQYARTGHPDLVSLNHDLYRGLKNGSNFWVMEQQCGHANWAQYNPLPAEGAVALWTAQAWAHGASGVMYFRFRASHYAQEIMHSGLLQQDGRPDRGYTEVNNLDVSQFQLGAIDAKVAILHDYPSMWAYDNQSHHQDLSYWAQFVQYYSALRSLGIEVDIIHASQLGNKDYSLIVAPALTVMDEATADALKRVAQRSPIIFGPRTATRTANGTVPNDGQFALIEELVGIKLLNFDSLRPTMHQRVKAIDTDNEFAGTLWCESYELLSAEPLLLYSDGPMAGSAAVTLHKNVTVIGLLSQSLLKDIFTRTLTEQGVPTQDLPEGLRMSRRAGKLLVQNFNQYPVEWQHHRLEAVSSKLIDLPSQNLI
jgi:beta-galactosidase